MQPNLNSFVSVPLPTALVNSLLTRFPHGISSLIENVVNDYLDRTEEDFVLPNKTEGVHWEALFLPSGTEVRTKYFGEYKTAVVEGENIVWDGKTYSSFARLTNAMRGGTMNNAWNELHVKRPTDETWISAQSIRRSN